jgi:hypothetical protein
MCTSCLSQHRFSFCFLQYKQFFFSVPEKLKVIFSDHNRRIFTTQKLPVIRYFKTLNQKTKPLEVKNILSSFESFQTLQLLNTHLVNFKFVLRNYFFTVFAIYFVDRKYEVNSWIDIV